MTRLDDKFLDKIPDPKLKSGVSEYIRLWNAGLKKQANAVVKSAMEHFDTLPETEQSRFFDMLCEALEGCDCIRLSHEVSVRLREYLCACAKRRQMPQSRWYCVLYNIGVDNEAEIYSAHSEDFALARHYYGMLIAELSFGAHHFPEGCCIMKADYARYCGECERVLKNHPLDGADYLYYKALYEAYYLWDGKSDFTEHCKCCGVAFKEIPAYYYR